MARIGIMGGTFNPIHKGHIEIAKTAQEQYHLQEIWFIPNHIPAYKSTKDIVSGEQRLHMVNLAIQHYPTFKTMDIELKREGNTYTYVTMQALKEQYPNNAFYFILGADSLFSFEKWLQPELIVKNTDILCALRNDIPLDEILQHIAYLNKKYKNDSFHFVQCANIPCSSSDIRCYLSAKESTQNLQYQIYLNKYLDTAVYEYIKKQHLYS